MGRYYSKQQCIANMLKRKTYQISLSEIRSASHPDEEKTQRIWYRGVYLGLYDTAKGKMTKWAPLSQQDKNKCSKIG